MKDLIKILESLAMKVKACVEDGSTIVPTLEMHEALKSAVLALEQKQARARKNANIVLEPKAAYARDLKGAAHMTVAALSRIRGDGEEIAAALYSVQGEGYAQAFQNARMKAVEQGAPLYPLELHVGTDHAASFREYLLREMKMSGSRVTDKGDGKTEWFGMQVFASPGRNSYVTWKEGVMKRWIDTNDLRQVHSTVERPTTYLAGV